MIGCSQQSAPHHATQDPHGQFSTIGQLSVRLDISWNISKRRRRVPLAEIRAARDPTERSGSLYLPQKSLGIRLDLRVHGVTLRTVAHYCCFRDSWLHHH